MKRTDILNSIKISKEDVVLEIGPGNMPFYRADIYLERDLNNNIERAGDFKMNKTCVLGDAHNLPFDDKSIDYIFCAQVLEHSDNPREMLKEIIRVGRRGYIETPNFYRELLFGWPFHKWIVEIEGDKLVLYENKLPQYFGSLFHILQAEEYSGQIFFNLNFEKFNTVFKWESSFEYEIKTHEDLIAKYTKETGNKFCIRHNERSNNVNYRGILNLRLIVDCVPFLSKYKDSLLKIKNFFNRKKVTQLDSEITCKIIIGKMACMNCGGKFEQYLGQKKVGCKSCDNFLTIDNGRLIIDKMYKGNV
ncbi:methyltransferase domain-containing protein [bacterium]|nr:methyltransferase domain-containing protein [bacterium]